MHYRSHSTMVKKCKRWYPTKAEAIAAFERACKRKGLASPLPYPSVSGDSITANDIAYPRSTCGAGMRAGHATVYVEACNDFMVTESDRTAGALKGKGMRKEQAQSGLLPLP